jgi:RNA polymerase sigma-70 factor, ECF subfamily
LGRSDTELIDAARAGEYQAFGVLVDRYSSSVCRRIAAKTHPWMDREALCQEVFITAYRKLTQLHDKLRFEAWLCHIADNCARKCHRKHLVQVELPSDDELGETCLVEPVYESADETMVKAKLRTALGRLADRQREALLQHYMQGKSYREIGLSLNCKENTVRSRLQKARARMRKEMDDMKKDMEAKNVMTLDRQSLLAISIAAKARLKSDKRPIRGIFLENSGKVVGTDGRHIVIRDCAALKNLSESALILPPDELERLDAKSATLIVGISEAILQIEGKDALTLPLLAESYVPYSQVFPSVPWRYSLSMPLGKLNSLIEEMTPYLEGRHPNLEGHEYVPQAKFRFSVTRHEMSVSIDSAMGYEKTKAEGDVCWEHSSSVRGKMQTAGPVEDIIVLDMNFRYFQNAISGLCNTPDEIVEIRVIDAMTPVVCLSPDRQNSISALMPMREK